MTRAISSLDGGRIAVRAEASVVYLARNVPITPRSRTERFPTAMIALLSEGLPGAAIDMASAGRQHRSVERDIKMEPEGCLQIAEALSQVMCAVWVRDSRMPRSQVMKSNMEIGPRNLGPGRLGDAWSFQLAKWPSLIIGRIFYLQ